MGLNKRLISTAAGGLVNTKNFAPVLYTGNSTNDQSITGVGFQPDFVWIKGRNTTSSGTAYHGLWDSVRGISSGQLSSSLTNAEFSGYPNRLYSFDLDGFSLGNGVDPEYIGNRDYVAWCWKAGGAAVSNTDGTITSQVSANQDAGFSIVKYTGEGAARTVGHGLSATPEMVIVKNLDDARNWLVYHKDLSASSYAFLNLTNAEETDTRTSGGQPRPFGPFTSTTFGVNIDNETGHTNDYIAYCFHSVDGYQKIGSYVGNSSTAGPLIDVGFRPRFIMVKGITSGYNSHWMIIDSIRDTDTTKDKRLLANLTNIETDDPNWATEFNDNGFQPKSTFTGYNHSSGTYIYLAIA
jgi:hypothetical protein